MTKPSLILGLSAMRHDSGAALMRNGKLLAAVEEERVTNVKHIGGWPQGSIEYVLETAGVTADQIDLVADNLDLPTLLSRGARDLLRDTTDDRGRNSRIRVSSFIKVAVNIIRRRKSMRAQFSNAARQSVRHHEAHAWYAIAAGGFEPGAVLVVDGIGESACTTMYDFDGSDLREHFVLRSTDSLGYIYGAVTDLIGRRRNDEEGTIMALASLGDPEKHRGLFERMIQLTDQGYSVDRTLVAPRAFTSRIPRLSKRAVEALGGQREQGIALGSDEADVAAALQKRIEETMLHLAQMSSSITNRSVLYVSGGVAMNCKSIGVIAQADLFERVVVPPSPGDAGTALGVAIAASEQQAFTRDAALADAFKGPAFAKDEICAALERRGHSGEEYPSDDELAQEVARMLADGLIVGVFHGAAELGPRALGNRSILAAADNADVVERLALEIKKREQFRPFAPAILADRHAEYFTPVLHAPYMSIAVQATDVCRRNTPAVIHVDNSARVETVTAEAGTILRLILEYYEKKTGVPVLINTSLNVKGKPTAGRPDDAIDAFEAMGLDALVVGPFLIR